MLRGMKKTFGTFVSALALSLLAACGDSSAANKAVGTYKLDKAAMKTAMEAQMPEEAKGSEMAAQMMEQMMGSLDGSIELKADGSAALSMKMPPMVDEQTTGTWKLEGEKITITAKNKDGAEEAKVAAFADGTITIEEEQDGKKMKIVFRKAEQK